MTARGIQEPNPSLARSGRNNSSHEFGHQPSVVEPTVAETGRFSPGRSLRLRCGLQTPRFRWPVVNREGGGL